MSEAALLLDKQQAGYWDPTGAFILKVSYNTQCPPSTSLHNPYHTQPDVPIFLHKSWSQVLLSVSLRPEIPMP